MHALVNSFVITFGSIAIYLAVLRFLSSRQGKMLMCRLMTSRPGKILLAQVLMRFRSSGVLAATSGDPESAFLVWSSAAFSVVPSFILA